MRTSWSCRSYSVLTSHQIGIVVGLLSTCVQSIGLTLQRKSHLLEDEKEDENIRRPPYKRRRWQIGMTMFIISNLVGSTIQITTLPLPVLSTLQASGLVFNTICASLILKECFTIWSFVGTALVAAGAVLIALFGALPEPSHTLQQLLDLLGRQQFILWMVGSFLAIAFVLLSIVVLNRIHPHPQSHRLRVYKGFAYGGISSILSAHSLLVAKSAVELLVRTIIDHKNQFNRWQSWVILLLLVFFALTQLYFLHRGLKLVSTSILYPFVFCVYNIIAILDGLIYFHQTSRLSALHAGLIAVGTAILLSGVLCLSWRTNEESDAPPPADAHTLLTPGMGLVEDTTTEDERGSDIDDDNASVTSADEEARISTVPSEHTPLLFKGRSLGRKDREDAFLRIVKNRRKRTSAANEDEEIRDELVDTAADDEWKFPAPGDLKTEHVETGSEQAAVGHGLQAQRFASQSSKSRLRHPGKSMRKHDRTRSEDIGASAADSRTSSASPKALRRALLHHPRAKTVHVAGSGFGSTVSFAPPSHASTWRERDRDHRRRTWSRGGIGSGGSAHLHHGASYKFRGRSESAPLDGRARNDSRPRSADRAAEQLPASNAAPSVDDVGRAEQGIGNGDDRTPRRSVRVSVSGWIGGFFSSRRAQG